MVYDEGVEINFQDGHSFFAFFKYVPKGNDPDPDEVTDFDSICHKTIRDGIMI